MPRAALRRQPKGKSVNSKIKSVVLLSGLTIATTAFASLRTEVTGRTLICAKGDFTYRLTFDGDAGRVSRQFNERPAERVRVQWHSGSSPNLTAEIPLENDLDEPALLERRSGRLFYDGLPCR